eukprot:m.43405 g.43405  ORF g.43405 m.43405 type:complete len:121 (+) comp12922_c0_seq1:206-568(+)
MELLSILSAFATVSTVGLFLTGIPVTQRIRRARSSANVTFFPYLAGVFSGILWLKYGMLIGDPLLMLVNGTGAALNAYYLLICYTYTKVPVSGLILSLPCIVCDTVKLVAQELFALLTCD